MELSKLSAADTNMRKACGQHTEAHVHQTPSCEINYLHYSKSHISGLPLYLSNHFSTIHPFMHEYICIHTYMKI